MKDLHYSYPACDSQNTFSEFFNAIQPRAPPSAPSPAIKVNVTVVTDKFAEETSWVLTHTVPRVDSNGLLQDTLQTVASGGGYTQKHTAYTQEVALPGEGNYTLRVLDSYGDGICCGAGQGRFALTFEDMTLVSGGSFGHVSETSFVINREELLKPRPASPPQTPAPKPLPPSPPAPPPLPKLNIAVVTDGFPRETRWKLTTPDGTVMMEVGGHSSPSIPTHLLGLLTGPTSGPGGPT